MAEHEAFKMAYKIIEGCRTDEQLDSARRFADLIERLYPSRKVELKKIREKLKKKDLFLHKY